MDAIETRQTWVLSLGLGSRWGGQRANGYPENGPAFTLGGTGGKF